MRWTEADVAAFQKRRGAPAVKVVKPIERRSKLEIALLAQIEAESLPKPHCEYRWHPTRKWRLDFAWPQEGRSVGVEVQGMVHRIKARFKADIEKRAELLLAGWRVLEVDGDSIRDGRALAWVKRLLT